MVEFPLVCDSCDAIYESEDDLIVSEIHLSESSVVNGYACPSCYDPLLPRWKRLCNLPGVRRYLMLEKLIDIDDIPDNPEN